jgi:ATP-dependent Clp protease ATP-binding subunit ClpC
MVKAEVKRVFNPEFLNRLDEIIIFNPLSDEDLLKIMHLMVGLLNKNLEPREITVKLTDAAGKWIVDKTCLDRSYGARPLRRALQKYIEDPLSEALIQGTIPKPAELEVILEGDGLYYRPAGSQTEGEPLGEPVLLYR